MNEQAAAKGVNEGADCFSRSLSGFPTYPERPAA